MTPEEWVDDFVERNCEGFVTRRAADEVRAELLERLRSEREQCIAQAREVAASFNAAGAHIDAWGAASVANYLNPRAPFGFIGPYKPGPGGKPWRCDAPAGHGAMVEQPSCARPDRT